jgi:coenzyme F420-0:L-glutamate ligase / coenzyme F420-1:gamma-L-glutamate ligase
VTPRLSVRAVGPLPELADGDDLAGMLIDAAPDLADGDVLTVSSKAVAKTEGRIRAAGRDEVVAEETDRQVAAWGAVRILRTRTGLVLAAAGVDESNTAAGTVVPLPVDCDVSARSLREAVWSRTGRNIAVVVTDTAGRAWRVGQTDIAAGCAGLLPLHDLAGTRDGWGHELQVTAPAVADEVAGAAELVLAKSARTPAAVVSGLAALVCAPDQHGPGAAALVRPEATDLFGLGSADAVLAATRRAPGDVRGYPAAPGTVRDRLAALLPIAATDGAVRHTLGGSVDEPVLVLQAAGVDDRLDPEASAEVLLSAGAVLERVRVLGWAAGLHVEPVSAPPGAICAVTVRSRP